jgi:glutamyl-tRNA synthetase
MSDLHTRIEAHALANALKYNGKANPGNVLPKIIGEFPDSKADIVALRKKIDEIVIAVNQLSPETQKSHLEKIGADLLEKKPVKEKDLPPLPHAEIGKVVTRLPPEPSKYNHLGHAMSFLINTVYAHRYEGKVVLRFEDTNPEKVNQEFVDNMLEDLIDYLGIQPNDIRFVSDDMEQLLQYATKLIELGAAYMCFCDRETMGKLRLEGVACKCRNRKTEEHVTEWKHFQEGKYMKGEGVLRYAGQMDSQNTVLRDPVLYRAIATPHFRLGSKYNIWPLYDFYNPIEDVLCGITHIMRSNEFELRVPLHQQIKQHLGLPDQHVLQYGRINITGATTKGREIRALIESGEYMGWDDPRLVTLKALKRRGIKREAYYELVKTLGLSPNQVSLDFSMLAAANRKFIENVDRYSFVEDPVTITIHGAVEKEIELDLHPDRKGGRKMSATDTYLISATDMAAVEGKRVRLMGLLTAQEHEGTFSLITYEQQKKGHDIIVNWLPAAQSVAVEVMMPDATVKKGRAESNISSLKPNDIIQFERFGFCRLDAIENATYKFWYTHK